MENCQGHDFTEYPTLRCAGLLGGLEAILRTHPECVEAKRTYRAVLKRVFQIYRETLSVVADAEINDHGEEEDGEAEDMKSLLSKGPVQAIPEGSSASGGELVVRSDESAVDGDESALGSEELAVHSEELTTHNGESTHSNKSTTHNEESTTITPADHIAKNKLDCRGHIIGEADPQKTLHLKRLMLTCWLTCKHSALALAQLVTMLPDSAFESSSESSSESSDLVADLEHVTSFLNASDPQDLCLEGSESRLRDSDVVFLVWDLLVSVLTIKHIGGIVFVAEAIASIVRRLSALVAVNGFLSSLPGSFVSVLLDEENINNRNFILRRSTGYSKAICSVALERVSKRSSSRALRC